MPDFTDTGMGVQGAESRSRDVHEATKQSSVESPAPACVCNAPSYPPSYVYIMQLLPSGLAEDPLKSPGVSYQEGIAPSSSWGSSHDLYDQASVRSMAPYPGVMCMVTSPVADSATITYDCAQKDDPDAPCVIFYNQLDIRDKEGVNDLPAINNADFFKTSAITPFLSLSVLGQADEDGEKTGVIGPDGCWYPLHKNAGETSGSEVVSKKEVAAGMCGEEQEDDKESDVSMRPQSVDIKQSLHRPPLHLTIYNYFHHLNLPEVFVGRPVMLPTRRNKSYLCVFDMLVEYMNLLFRNLPDQWELKVAKRNCKPVTGWSTFKDFAKVRFCCKECQVGWTSMRGIIMFFYRWNWRLQRGQVLYHVLGQKCSACSPHTFEMPIWYPEEAQKIVTNLYYKICSEFYGLKTPQPIRTRRPGSSKSSHNGSLCQGCVRGVCLVE
ncbi:uncharacterized protein LOC125028109 [Penaeus chinensis]|uniref:uncharacterized protein LOC125028109 n=1 Tax=Penaeus chinensis TaxID=139456 RepID=UPI001FB692AA|nr:uncharacterized protein LOC125028109 [Penaeus chinensis]